MGRSAVVLAMLVGCSSPTTSPGALPADEVRPAPCEAVTLEPATVKQFVDRMNSCPRNQPWVFRELDRWKDADSPAMAAALEDSLVTTDDFSRMLGTLIVMRHLGQPAGAAFVHAQLWREVDAIAHAPPDDDMASIRASMLGEVLACTCGAEAHAWALEAAASFPSRAVTSAIQRRLDDHLCLKCPAGECASPADGDAGSADGDASDASDAATD